MTKEKKTPYETPIIISLGELAKGSGRCGAGSNGQASDPNCANGGNPKSLPPPGGGPPPPSQCMTGGRPS